jgi:hypothetical protein
MHHSRITGFGLIGDTLDTVLSIFKGLGDKVPKYPVREIETFNGVMKEIRDNFADPVSADHARQMLAQADLWIRAAEQKGGPVNMTYKQVLEEDIIPAYKQYLASAGAGPGGVTYVPPAGGTGQPPASPVQKQAGMSTIAMVGLGLLALGMLSKKR